jgi:site-specific recombinase XerD
MNPMHNSALPAPSAKLPAHLWAWPPVPQTFHLLDKYNGVESRLVLGETTWITSVQGVQRKHDFLAGESGLFQQKLVLLTQAHFSPSSFYKFTYTLLRHWKLLLKLLATEPDNIKPFWDRNILTVDIAKTAKSILNLALANSLGVWNPSHKHLVKSLSTRANSGVSAQRGKIENRSTLIATNSQVEIVRLLDAKAREESLAEWQIEGLATLALAFQHGIRPVQTICISMNHVQVLDEADGKSSTVISFHEAKKKGNTESLEMSRQVNSEWAPLIHRLMSLATAAGRNRLFSVSSSTKLWNNTKKVCKQFGVQVDFNYYKLRHTAAQTLADAGHSRNNVNGFLGQAHVNAATPYIKSSRKQGAIVNDALGTSTLYNKLEAIATGEFITLEELEKAHEDKQVAGIVGDRSIAGIGLCSSGQAACVYDPIMSCYNCKKYMPVLNPVPHMEAIAGMRQQVIFFLKRGGKEESPAYLQLKNALSGAQKALDISRKAI